MLLLLLVALPVQAGFVSRRGQRIQVFEPSKNVLYRGIAGLDKKGNIDENVIKNIAVVNLSTDEVSYIFGEDFKEEIWGLVFEFGYAAQHSRIDVYDSVNNNTGYSSWIRNNYDLEKRPVRDRLLVITNNPNTGSTSIWFCNKMGQDLKRVRTFDRETDWWIDMRNEKICFAGQVGRTLSFESIPW